MLKFIRIENFALIDRLEVEFGPGLNLITGETGSGKSILVDAVGLLLGGRASQEMIRQGFDTARLEGLFEIVAPHPASAYLQEAGVALAEGECIVRREISRSGANKVFVNGTLSTQSFLAGLGSLLADIHGQHEQQQLLQPATHLEFLDAFGRNHDLRQAVLESHRRLEAVREQLGRLQGNEQERLQRLDLLQYQAREIEALQLRPGLDQELESERQLLASAELRFHHSQESYQLLYEQEPSILGLAGRVETLLEELAEQDPSCSENLVRLRELRFQLEEIAYQLRDYAQQVEFNPARLEAVEERLGELHRARRKYGETVDLILEYYQDISRQILDLSGREERLQELEEERKRLEQEYYEKARQLSEKRRRDAAPLRQAVEGVLSELAMENTRFVVHLESSPERYSQKGIDRVEFLISPNPGEDLRPLAKIASGGELSRTILALKSILTLEDYPKTLVFDEVDAGIGGRVASNIGEKLARLASRHQVFCVTHLPQIAAFADRHYHVDKRTQQRRTVVRITPLEGEAREQELARMLAGEQVTETTRRQARELLQTGRQRSRA